MVSDDDEIVLVQGLRYALRYDSAGYPGSFTRPFLRREAATRLLSASRYVEHLTEGRCALFLWDALRSPLTQQFLFDRQKDRLRILEPWLTANEADDKAALFVHHPATEHPAPHCTGGAVDLTIASNGEPLSLGQFDDFSDSSATHFFDTHEPRNSAEEQIAEFRNLLWYAMVIIGGYVAVPEEWWHFEYGTRHWACITGEQELYRGVVAP